MDRIRKISLELLDSHKDKFGTDFDHNKKVLSEVAIVRSKELRNELAGYITRLVKKEIDEQKAREQREQAKATEQQQSEVMAKEPEHPATGDSEVEEIAGGESEGSDNTAASGQDTSKKQGKQGQDTKSEEVVTTTNN